MITFTVLAILGVLLIVVLALMWRAPRRPAQPDPVASPAAGTQPAGKTDLWNARHGDVISIHAAADDYSDVDFSVDRRSAYSYGNRRWLDLSGEFRGQRVYLEVEPGAAGEVMGLLDGRKLTLADIGSTEPQLADFDTKQNSWLYLEFDGKRWQYESSREIGYFENEQGPGEGLYRWIFREKDGTRLLCVEKWEGEPFDVRIARRINPDDVSIYRAG
jgi:hypothetical protein